MTKSSAITEDEYIENLELGLSVLSRKVVDLREQNHRILLAVILASGGSIRISKEVLMKLNIKDHIMQAEDPVTGDYIYTAVIQPRK